VKKEHCLNAGTDEQRSINQNYHAAKLDNFAVQIMKKFLNTEYALELRSEGLNGKKNKRFRD